ncbi:GCN5-related N-acetyltransferase [Acidovorax delafieldii 2AN]|uniref:GCN5-related N-acetyltransferase n=1 Tax=Acidovorax delafieldii 2AN TaxID=573060 RepID=C5SZW4_ACIDE|nr:GNAT family N-acetyltransferase [Acidovorax delafieldii]EER62280.1 GCN5-related N-acetyltransferase [Acidovorax delafieldii 2AN]
MWPSSLDISPLLPVHRSALGLHLLALPAEHRYARFGATLNDEAVLRWVARLAWEQQRCWGAWLPGDLGLVGVLQLAHTRRSGSWELALTVAAALHGRGVGTTLLATALGQMPDVRQLVCQHGHAAIFAMAKRLGFGVHRQGRQLWLEAVARSGPAPATSRQAGIG